MTLPTYVGKASIDVIRIEGSNTTYTKWWMRYKTISGIQVGDRMMAVCGLFKNTPETTIIAPKGWSLLLDMNSCRVYTKIATVDDTFPELVSFTRPQDVSFIFYNPKSGGLRTIGEFCEVYAYRGAPIIGAKAGRNIIPPAGAPITAQFTPQAAVLYPSSSMMFTGEMSFRFGGPAFGSTGLTGHTTRSKAAPQTPGTWSWVIGDRSLVGAPGNVTWADSSAIGWSGNWVTYDSYDIFTVVLVGNLPPNTPVLQAPSSGSVLDLEFASSVFDWTYNNPDGSAQAKYAFRRATVDGTGTKSAYQYWRSSDSTWQSAETWNTSSVSEVDFGPGHWTNNVQYAWSVAVQSPAALSSSYSSDSIVNANTRPSVTITTPDSVWDTSSYIDVAWEVLDPELDPQQWYEIAVLTADSATIAGFNYQNPTGTARVGGIVWGSGQVSGSVSNVTVPVALHNRTTYLVFVRIFNGQQSDWNYQSTTIALMVPNPPIVRVFAE